MIFEFCKWYIMRWLLYNTCATKELVISHYGCRLSPLRKYGHEEVIQAFAAMKLGFQYVARNGDMSVNLYNTQPTWSANGEDTFWFSVGIPASLSEDMFPSVGKGMCVELKMMSGGV